MKIKREILGFTMYFRPTLFSTTLDRCSREGRVQYKEVREKKEKKKRKGQAKGKGEDKR